MKKKKLAGIMKAKTVVKLSKAIANATTEDIAFIEGTIQHITMTSQSAENALVEIFEKAVLPSGATAKCFSKELLDGSTTTLEILRHIWGIYSKSCPSIESKSFKNEKEFLYFMMHILGQTTLSSDDAVNKEHFKFCKEFGYIIQILDDELPIKDKTASTVNDNPLKYASHMLQEAKEEPYFFVAQNFIKILYDNWDILKKKRATYDALMYFCDTVKYTFIDSNNNHLELIQMMKKYGNEWGNNVAMNGGD